MRVVVWAALIALLAPFALASPAQAAIDPAAVYRAVNLNGAAVTVGGVPFEADTGGAAPNLTWGPRQFCNQNVALSPATNTATATMLRCSVWGTGSEGGTYVTMTSIPSGSYKVSLYNWEDSLDASSTFSLKLNGATVATNIESGAKGAWKLLGPYTVNITDGTLKVTTTTTTGAANLSGIVLERTTTARTGPGLSPVRVTRPALAVPRFLR